MRLGGFETRLLSGDVAALEAFYRSLGFAPYGAPGEVRLARGDCRLALAPAGAGAAGRTALAFAPGDGAAGQVDPDGTALVEAARTDGEDSEGAAAPYDPVLGWYELSLDVADIARTAAFYGRLGFEAAGGDIAQRHLTLQRGHGRICLYQGYLDPAGTQLIFWQGDVAAVAALAEREGLKVRRGLLGDDEGQLSLMLEDPDGRGVFFIFIPGVERLEPARHD
ncbi:VOC family protein [Caulobacter sp. KR2-114]|uniref:VOC family protein n=1 Tax=Caulobacter sp. KR2-114 TaxID=3400912 RepID=UPI003C0116B8